MHRDVSSRDLLREPYINPYSLEQDLREECSIWLGKGYRFRVKGWRWSEPCRDQGIAIAIVRAILGALARLRCQSDFRGHETRSVRCALIRVDLVVAPETTEGP